MCFDAPTIVIFSCRVRGRPFQLGLICFGTVFADYCVVFSRVDKIGEVYYIGVHLFYDSVGVEVVLYS